MWTTTQLGLILVFGTVLASAKVKEISIETIELSPGSEAIFTLENTIEQLNSTAFAVTAHYVQKVELDNSYSVQMIFSMGTRGNNFIEVYRTKPEGICDFLKSGASKLKMEVPLPSDMDLCPIPPFEFSLEKEEVNVESLLAMGMPGKFRAVIVISQGGAEKAKITTVIVMK